MPKTIEVNAYTHMESSFDSFTEEEIAEIMTEAKEKLPKLVSRYAKSMTIEYEQVFVKRQKTRWGSCSDRGNISLNCLLMRVPAYVRKYVIIHELAHRKIMNHSVDFWAIVAKEMPNYRTAIKWLRTHGDELISKLGM